MSIRKKQNEKKLTTLGFMCYLKPSQSPQKVMTHEKSRYYSNNALIALIRSPEKRLQILWNICHYLLIVIERTRTSNLSTLPEMQTCKF